MRIVSAILLLAACQGCHPRPTPTPTPTQTDIPVCTLPVAPTTRDVCDAMFTVKEQIPCAVCGMNGQGCYDKVDGVYCVKGACLADPTCQRFNPPDTSYP